jgi:hypothetical protein
MVSCVGKENRCREAEIGIMVKSLYGPQEISDFEFPLLMYLNLYIPK